MIADDSSMPEPLLAFAITPKTKGDEEKLSTALARLREEDPTLRVDRSEETHETVMYGMGEAHLDVMMERMKRKFGVEVTSSPARIAYRETIRKPAKALGRHVKQSGGHGQYAICNIEVEPLPRGGGFEFVDKIFGGAIPNQFIPSVEKGVVKAMQQGVISGNPMVDIRCTLVDGKFHTVDSSDMAFQIAGLAGAARGGAGVGRRAARADRRARGHRPRDDDRRRDGRPELQAGEDRRRGVRWAAGKQRVRRWSRRPRSRGTRSTSARSPGAAGRSR